MAETLDEDAVIVEGYAEYATWRPHLAYLRDPYGDPDVEMELDGVGGVSILAKARVFRAGVHFPAFSFERHAETEGFGKMARRMKYSVVGLPHYTICKSSMVLLGAEDLNSLHSHGFRESAC